MKDKRMFVLAALLTVAGCMGVESGEPAGDGSVEITVRCSSGEFDGKSSMNPQESAISDVNVYFYRDGLLDVEAYSASSSVKIDLTEGCLYNVYALANTGEFHAPALESDLASFRYAVSSVSSMYGKALPMASSSPAHLKTDIPDYTLVLDMTRLAGRLDFNIEKHLENCDFTVTSAQLCQSALDVSPFSGASAASSVGNGDSSSAADVSLLNSGGTMSLYLLENCQGALLPSNTDPWKKIPDNIPEKSSLCTYLQISGTWTTPGASANLTYRMYLGQDNCGDFNVLRNAVQKMTLVLYDQGTLQNSWKVEMSSFSEGRSLYFKDSSISILQGGAESSTQIISSPGDMKYELTVDDTEIEDAKMNYKLSEGRLTFSSNYSGTTPKTVHFRLSTWDGKLQDVLTVTVTCPVGAFTDYEHVPATFSESWGVISLPSATSAAPVSFSVAGKTWKIGSALGSSFEYVRASSANMIFYYISSGSKVYYRSMGENGSGTVEVILSRGLESSTLQLHEACAAKFLVDDVSLSEIGTDSNVDICLDDGHGEILDLSTFEVPSEMLSVLGIGASSRYKYLEEAYWESVSVEKADESFAFTIDEAGTDNLFSDDRIAVLSMWGLDAGGDAVKDTKLSMLNDYFNGGQQDFNVRIIPAFPAQRYLGEVTNYQIAPGSMRKMSSSVSFSSGGAIAPSKSASWTVRDAYYDASDTPSAGLAVASAGSGRGQGAHFNGSSLTFDSPDTARPPVSGAFLLTGTAVNGHSGRTICGYYTIDVVLYMTVGVQVDFDGSVVHYSFVPFCEYSSHGFSDIWNDWFPAGLTVWSWNTPSGNADYESWFHSSVHVPESEADNGCSYTVAGGNFQTGTPEQCCRFLYYANMEYLFSNFWFYLDFQRFSSLDFSRTGYASTVSWSAADLVRGKSGYYSIHRQKDVSNIPEVSEHYGLDNLVVEAAYGSFTQF